MYLDLFSELRLNKRLVKIAGFEVAAYWAELQSILRQVVKKRTADELGFFRLDRDYLEKETTLTINKQLKCEETLIAMGVVAKDPNNPNKLSISVSNMIEVITDEDNNKLKKPSVAVQKDAKLAKLNAIKFNMKKALLEPDLELRSAYERWIEGMMDSASCRFNRAIVQLFEKTITDYTQDKAVRLKIIEIATVNSYKDATWAINKLPASSAKYISKIPEQKICKGVSDNLVF